MNEMNDVLSHLYNGVSRKNTTLMELSTVQHTRLKGNCIHVSDVRISGEDKNVYYNKVSYGKNISLRKLEKNTGGNKKHEYINLHKTKGCFMLITGYKSECINIAPNTYSFATTTSYR